MSEETVVVTSRTDFGGQQVKIGPMRVLHVLDHSRPLLSGYAVRSHSLLAAQKEIGLAPEVVTGPLHQLDDATSEDVTINGLCYRRTGLPHGLDRRLLKRRVPVLRELTVVRLLRKRILDLLDAGAFDIVHAHSPALCGLAALQAANARSLPFVYEIRAFWEDAAVDQRKTKIRSYRYQIARQLETYVARHADGVVGIARHILEDLQERGLNLKKLFHIPNGVDARRFKGLPRDAALAAQLGLSDKDMVLGFIGSLYRYEGIPWLVRAGAQLRRQGASFQILIVGRGEDESDTRAAIQECNAERYVRMLGEVPHEQIHRYYSLMDVMVYPRRSVRLTELTTPLKPLEAMAQSKAVLASDVGGIRELVEPDQPCLLFKPNDVEDFCRAAGQLIRDERFRLDLGDAARLMILREKDWKVLARRYEIVYSFARQKNRSKAS